MERIFLGATGVFGIVILRMLLLPEDSVLGALVTYGAVIAFFSFCHWMISSDKLPEVVEAARSRVDGIE